MEYLPYWNIDDSQKKHFLNMYEKKYIINREESVYLKQKQAKVSHFIKSECIKATKSKLSNHNPSNNKTIKLIRDYYIDFENLKKSNLEDPHTWKTYLPKNLWKYILSFYHELCPDRMPWSEKLDKQLGELFNFSTIIGSSQKRLHISFNEFLYYFLIILGEYDWAELFQIDSSKIHLINEYSRVFGWPRLNYIHSPIDDLFISFLSQININKVMIPDILDIFKEYYNYLVSKKISKYCNFIDIYNPILNQMRRNLQYLECLKNPTFNTQVSSYLESHIC